jgi:hypothetical protein
MKTYPLKTSCGLAAPDVRFLMSNQKLVFFLSQSDRSQELFPSRTVRESKTLYNRKKRLHGEE